MSRTLILAALLLLAACGGADGATISQAECEARCIAALNDLPRGVIIFYDPVICADGACSCSGPMACPGDHGAASSVK